MGLNQVAVVSIAGANLTIIRLHSSIVAQSVLFRQGAELRIPPLILLMERKRDRDIPLAVNAGSATPLFARGVNRGQHESGEQTDDRDDDEQFD